MSETRSRSLLARLVGFRSVTRESNLELIHFVSGLLREHGIASVLVHDESATKANLFASVGPDAPGVLLSGHTDVVPVDGQPWTVPPFELTERDGRLYGRGSADMKGFIACALHAMIEASRRTLRRPLQIALSYDEEIGCVGVRRLIDVLETAPVRPFVCVVGEPTLMRVAVGHKGKTALRAVCHGEEGHSALAPRFVNALHLGCEFVDEVRRVQQRLASEGAQDASYDVACTTLHVGRLEGGKALNIVPRRCEVDFEIRNIAADDPQALVGELADAAGRIAERASSAGRAASIDIETLNAYPGLDTSPTEHAAAFVRSIALDSSPPVKVAFGTEGGLFSSRLQVPTVVCGPGSIDVAHRPDEYVEAAQLALCDAFLARLLARCCA